MNRLLSRPWLMVALVSGVLFTSCNKDDRQEPNSPTEQQGETITLSLSAEIGFEEEQRAEGELKAFNFKIEDVGGKKIPRPQLEDGQEVEVFTAVKREEIGPHNTTVVVKKLKWTYNEKRRKLVLKKSATDNDFEFPSFGVDPNWSPATYSISGLIAPNAALDGTNVKFEGTRLLRASEGKVEDDLSHLNIPYFFDWTELKPDKSGPKDYHGGYMEGGIPDGANQQFKPWGSLIIYKLGNKQTAGNYTFTPTGFSVMSNAYGDKVTFKFGYNNFYVPGNPLYYELEHPANEMSYKFAPGHEPGTINNNTKSDRIYYAWVITSLYPLNPENVRVRVILSGTSSRPETATYKDYTKTYYTDYTTEGKSSGGIVKHGKIHSLTANATRRVILPIEYITEYNLAGGVGLTYKPTYLNLPYAPYPPGPTHYGIDGPLRFSNRTSTNTPNPTPHHNEQGGYYNWYKLMGLQHETHNPASTYKNLHTENLIDTDGSTIVLNSKYFVPEIDHWWGIIHRSGYDWDDEHAKNDYEDYFQLGYETTSEYLHGKMYSSRNYKVGNDDVFYFIRFTPDRSSNFQYPPRIPEIFTDPTDPHRIRTYTRLAGCYLKCAYRYTRMGRDWSYGASTLADLNSRRMMIDVVYLGYADFAESGKTELQTISNQAWWDDPNSSRYAHGLTNKHTRVFPVPGYVQAPGDALSSVGYFAYMWSSNLPYSNHAWYSGANGHYFIGGGITGNGYPPSYGLPVRLFKRDPEQP